MQNIPKHRYARLGASLAVAGILCLAAHAEQLPLTCASVFGDGAVLQQGIELPVWGISAPGAHVSVQIAGQTVSGVADSTGNWKILLAPLTADALTALEKAPKGRTLTVSATHSKRSCIVTFSGILVGEVWLCSGQSNMAGKVRHHPVEDRSDNLLRSHFPDIRHTVGDGIWTTATKDSVNHFTRVGFCFARDIHRELHVPVGLLNASTGGSHIEAWMRAAPDVEIESPANSRPRTYGSNYAKLIAPMVGYGMRGALWYQGEANASEGIEYQQKLTWMIQDWRRSWQLGDFPFYFVQIAAIGTSPTNSPAMGDGRARIRDAQRRVLSTINTGMATAIDNGALKEHPPNKKEIGIRLAQWALHRDYDRAEVVPSGPLYKAHQIEGKHVRIKFDYADGLMKANRTPFHEPEPAPDVDLPWLSIQGEDGTWHWATATIDGKDLLVSSEKVSKPKAVRYATTNRPLGVYLYNAAGLPASPFATMPLWGEK
jgi:sialate O-acetylesterase